MAPRQRNAFLGIYDLPLWRDWIAWLTSLALIAAVINTVNYDYPGGIQGQEMAFLFDLALRSAFQFFLFGFIPGQIRKAIRKRRRLSRERSGRPGWTDSHQVEIAGEVEVKRDFELTDDPRVIKRRG